MNWKQWLKKWRCTAKSISIVLLTIFYLQSNFFDEFSRREKRIDLLCILFQSVNLCWSLEVSRFDLKGDGSITLFPETLATRLALIPECISFFPEFRKSTKMPKIERIVTSRFSKSNFQQAKAWIFPSMVYATPFYLVKSTL